MITFSLTRATLSTRERQKTNFLSDPQRTRMSALRIVLALATGALLLAAPIAPAQTPLPDDFNPGANDSVYSLAVQADGKILVGGYFTTLGGQTCNYLGRLNPDGTLDTGFNPGANSYVYSLAVQADGKILVGGVFSTLGGQTRNGIGRLNPDGTLDTAFNPGASGSVDSLAVQADGKILVGGQFTTLGGQTRNRIGRLNPDGTLDTAFDPRASSSVTSLAVQADGKILVGGAFTTLGSGQTRNYLGRLNPDGTLDTAFDPEANSYVFSLAVQADGKILVGGGFTTLGGQTCNRIGRLNPDGALDTAFNPGADDWVRSLAVQADGKVLVGGYFSTLGGETRDCLGRLNPDGTLDTKFNPEADDYVQSLAVQADGKILVGGQFTTLGGQTRNYLGRLNATHPATSSLSFDGSTITWLRGGTSPEVWRTIFDWSSDGLLWTPLGDGTRIPGGWQPTNALVPVDATIRARGFVTGGRYNGSGWFVEDYWGLAWVAQPQSRTNDAGTTAAFGAVAGGMPPLSYHWYKDGAALADGNHIAGATTAWLTLTNVLGADAGGYCLVVSNAYGARTSVVATLTVNDPVITVPPLSQNPELGENATLSVTALGTAPLGYQWWKDGVALMGRTAASLMLTNSLATDAGSYWVAVTSPYGSVTSQAALLTVNQATADPGFDPEADGGVFSLAVEADGKILVGGQFTTLGGQAGNYLARLNPDGTLDTGSNPGTDDGVDSLAVQADGKILVGGSFSTLGGQTRNCLGRLNPDGKLDTGFNLGADYDVDSLAVQADGKILVGGWFTTLGGQTRNYLGRLNPDGTLDAGFNPSADNGVYSLAVQADGKILVGGQFTTLGGQTRNNLGRLNPDGTLDTAFNPGAGGGTLPYVDSLAVQADGKILVGGDFSTLGGQTRKCLGRLNPDGTVDAGFNPGADDDVVSLAVQADGKILVGGDFSTLGGQTRNCLGRLNPNGTLDTGFNPGADDSLTSLAVQADGKILAGGFFSTLGGQTRNCLGRLNATDPATQSLSFDGSTITWLRGGTSPEVWRTTFDWSSDGLLWAPLGDGTRIPGGWQRTNALVPVDATIRAHGFVTGGEYNGSGWFVETLATNRSLAPQLSGVWRLSDGNIQFTGSGPAGAPYRVLVATNLGLPLGNWLQIGSGTFTGGLLDFADLQATNYPRRFYRIITP
jgi:uncharacterized delta-60 repeat protein